MKKFYLIILFLLNISLLGQTAKSSIGAGLGIGSFIGNFPTQTTFGTKLYFETESPLKFLTFFNFILPLLRKLKNFSRIPTPMITTLTLQVLEFRVSSINRLMST